MQVVAANAALQQPARHTRPEVPTEKIKALAALPEVHHLRLVWMQREPQVAEDLPGIDAGRPTVPLDALPRLPQDVTPTDTVKQRMKPALRGPLCTYA